MRNKIRHKHTSHRMPTKHKLLNPPTLNHSYEHLRHMLERPIKIPPPLILPIIPRIYKVDPSADLAHFVLEPRPLFVVAWAAVDRHDGEPGASEHVIGDETVPAAGEVDADEGGRLVSDFVFGGELDVEVAQVVGEHGLDYGVLALALGFWSGVLEMTELLGL